MYEMYTINVIHLFGKCPENTLQCECMIQMFANTIVLYSGKASVEKLSDITHDSTAF